MSHARLAPLHTLLEHEERERDAVRARALDARTQAQQARAQAHDLERYRSEQGQRWAQNFRTQGTPEILRCHHSFMQRLEHAITQQAVVAGHAEQRADAMVDVLRAHEQRVAAVRKLIERQQQSLRSLEQRAEQRREDEFALRSSTASRALGAPHEHGPVQAHGANAGGLEEDGPR